MTWMGASQDVHLYSTASFFLWGVSVDYGGVFCYSVIGVVGRLVPAGSRVGFLLLFTVTSH